MNRAPFSVADLKRAVATFRKLDLAVDRTEILPDGRIIVHHRPATPGEVPDEFAAWEEKRGARGA